MTTPVYKFKEVERLDSNNEPLDPKKLTRKNWGLHKVVQVKDGVEHYVTAPELKIDNKCYKIWIKTRHISPVVTIHESYANEFERGKPSLAARFAEHTTVWQETLEEINQLCDSERSKGVQIDRNTYTEIAKKHISVKKAGNEADSSSEDNGIYVHIEARTFLSHPTNEALYQEFQDAVAQFSKFTHVPFLFYKTILGKFHHFTTQHEFLLSYKCGIKLAAKIMTYLREEEILFVVDKEIPAKAKEIKVLKEGRVTHINGPELIHLKRELSHKSAQAEKSITQVVSRSEITGTVLYFVKCGIPEDISKYLAKTFETKYGSQKKLQIDTNHNHSTSHVDPAKNKGVLSTLSSSMAPTNTVTGSKRFDFARVDSKTRMKSLINTYQPSSTTSTNSHLNPVYRTLAEYACLIVAEEEMMLIVRKFELRTDKKNIRSLNKEYQNLTNFFIAFKAQAKTKKRTSVLSSGPRRPTTIALQLVTRRESTSSAVSSLSQYPVDGVPQVIIPPNSDGSIRSTYATYEICEPETYYTPQSAETDNISIGS